jgi:PPOX class probable F420-dependent enzyme
MVCQHCAGSLGLSSVSSIVIMAGRTFMLCTAELSENWELARQHKPLFEPPNPRHSEKAVLTHRKLKGTFGATRRKDMSITLPESVIKLLNDKAHGHVTTYSLKGRSQVTMVWLDVDGDEVVFNTAEGRLKPRNLRNDPRIIISAQDPENPRAFVVFYGLATVSEEGADAHIDKLAKKFMDVDTYPFRVPGEVRLIVRTKVDRIGGVDGSMQPWGS